MLNATYCSPYQSFADENPFDVPEAVNHAVLVFLCSHVDSRSIATETAVKFVRKAIPKCRLTDDQLEECAVRAAVAQEFSVTFDRQG